MFEFCSVCGRCVGYIFVTRQQDGRVMVWEVCFCGLHLCNPQTDGWVVGGGGMGYIFVTRKQRVRLLAVGGDIFVTRDGVMLLEYGGDAAWVWEGMY